MDDKKIRDILEKYQAGLCSEEEKAWVESWYLHLSDTSEEPELQEYELFSAKKEVWKAIVSQRPDVSSERRPVQLYYKTALAAAVLLVMGFAFYFLADRTVSAPDTGLAVHNDPVRPGGNKAYLTLADGKKINLSDREDGILLEQGGVRVVKKQRGELVYEVSGKASPVAGPAGNNTIETPVGGQYQAILPDGTKVWLNSSSSLEYPVQFAANERKVTLRGEGYFEVKSDKGRPFRVVSEKQTIEVLGTKFNVNTYEDETAVKTTLLEGSVKVFLDNAASRILRPGEQASVTGRNIHVYPVDTDQTVAWKNGDFAFEGIALKEIMQQISRWYGVEVVYRHDIGDIRFGGSISRSKDIQEVLKVLSMTKGVNFKLEGRRVLVMQ